MAFPTSNVLDTFTDASAPRNVTTYSADWTANFVPGDSSASPQTETDGTLGGQSGGITVNAYRNDISDADVEVFATITAKPANGSFVELAARIQSPGASLSCYFLAAFANTGTDTLELWKVVSGSFSQVATFQTAEFAAGDQLGMSVIGTSIKCYKNGTQVGTTKTDSSVTGAGAIGVRFPDNVCRIDSFGGGAPGSAGAAVALDAVIAGGATVAPSLSLSLPLTSSISGGASVAAPLSVSRPLSVAVAGRSTVAAQLALGKPLAAAIVVTATLIFADLTGGADVVYRRLRTLLGAGE